MINVVFKTKGAVANLSGAMETGDRFKNGVKIEMNQSRRDFVKTITPLAMGLLAVRLAGCSKPNDGPDPDPNGGGNGNGGGSTKIEVDTRGSETLRQQIYDYIVKTCGATHQHETSEEALACIDKEIQKVLRVSEQDLAGKFSHFKGTTHMNSKGYISSINLHESEVKSNSTCTKRKVTKGFDPSTNQIHHTIECGQ